MKKSSIFIAILLASLLIASFSCAEDFSEREWDIYYTYLEYIDLSENKDMPVEEIYREIAGTFGITDSEAKDIVARAPDKPSDLAYEIWNETESIPTTVSEEEKNRMYKEIEKKYGITEKRRMVMAGWRIYFYEYYLKPLYYSDNSEQSE